MVYNWDDKEAECYRLYVEEKRNLDEVISYWEVRGFTPRYVAARVNVWVAVCCRHLSETCVISSLLDRGMANMLTLPKQASLPDTVQSA